MSKLLSTGLIFFLMAGAGFAQSTVQLPLDASNCAILKALNAHGSASCLEPDRLGERRGIVLRIDEELKKQEAQDLNDVVRAPKIVTPKPAPRKAAVKTAALPTKSDANHAAAKPQGGYFIQFAFNSFDLEPEFEEHLGRLAKVLSAPAMEQTCIRVTGHTDTVGSEEYNKKLSQNRAVIVATRLSELGEISPERIQIAAEGETSPLPDIDGEDALNRRVEFSTKEATNGCSA